MYHIMLFWACNVVSSMHLQFYFTIEINLETSQITKRRIVKIIGKKYIYIWVDIELLTKCFFHFLSLIVFKRIYIRCTFYTVQLISKNVKKVRGVVWSADLWDE